MSAANSYRTSSIPKPPPLPKARGLSVVAPPAPPPQTLDEAEITSVDLEIPQIRADAVTVESDVRELRPTRPPPPRPSGVPRPSRAPGTPAHPFAKKSVPPPIPAATAPESDVEGPLPEAASAPVAGPVTIPAPPPVPRITSTDLDLERAAMRGGPLVGLRTAWFFGAFVAAGALRGVFRAFAAAAGWLAAEWRRAGSRARGLPPGGT